MQQTRFIVIVLLFAVCANETCAQTDVEMLIAKSDPVIQAQIQTTINALQQPGVDPRSNVEAIREVQTLKGLTDEKENIVEQLAIYAVTETREEDQQVLEASLILKILDLRPALVIRVLAPYLDAENRQLRDFAEIWFDSHDNADAAAPGLPPLQPVNYEDYMEYVSRKLNRNEEVPAGFVRYIYERSPGRALLVFAYANQHGDVVARLQAIRKKLIPAPQQGKEPDAQVKTGQQLEEGRQARLGERREIQLAEHIVSNAIWLKENEFAERFQAALPEAMAELAKLAKHKEWWARLYVAYVMQKYPELQQADVLQQLSTDSNALVSKAAKLENE